ncbi:ribonuclease kappa-like [Argonauta hians]
MFSCPVCGPKLSICGIVISVWGIVMLSLMGVFLHIRSPAFFEDLPLSVWKSEQYQVESINKLYSQASVNCFIAAGLYVAVLIFSVIQQRQNARASYVLS